MQVVDLYTVFRAITSEFTDEQRDQLMDLLVGRVPGWRIAEARNSPRPCEDRDAELTRLHEEDGLTYPEIGRLMHLRPEAVARAVQRFRTRRDSISLSPP